MVCPKSKRMSALLIVDPAKARAEILAAFLAGAGNRTKAAAALEIPLRSLQHYVTKLGLWSDIDVLCSDNGFEVNTARRRNE